MAIENEAAARWIKYLKMEKHPEGGYFTELYKCSETIPQPSGKNRSVASSIYFLLSQGDVSRFHRLDADELWYYHAGDPIHIFVINASGEAAEIKLGCNMEEGELPQAIIPGGSIFGAATAGPNGFGLVGCMVCPAFEYEEFELMERDALLKEYPEHAEIICKLTADR